MEFSNRNVQTQAAAPGQHSAPVGTPAKRRGGSDGGKWGRIGVAVAALAVTILLAGVITVSLSSNKNADAESKFVDANKLQAVFLNTGQVYFGNIKSLNNKYLVVTHIYYLQTANNATTGASTSSSDSSVSLVKLGCELHEPYDQMVINRDQVTFWENLQDGGQVAKAVTAFEKKNPQGQKCADQSSSASTTSGSSVQGAGNSSTTPAKP